MGRQLMNKNGRSKRLYLYSFIVGCDYFEHKLFYLSSELGLVTKGGKEDYLSLGNDLVNVVESLFLFNYPSLHGINYQLSRLTGAKQGIVESKVIIIRLPPCSMGIMPAIV